jgi:hypothetical protein
VSKNWKPNKKTVELEAAARPSRIRRDPVAAAKPLSLAWKAQWHSREWEIRLAFIGIIFVALAINALVIDIGQIISP